MSTDNGPTSGTTQQVSWEDVLELVTRLDGSGFADAEITLDGVTVRVSRTALPTAPGAPTPAPAAPVAPAADPAPAAAPAAAAPAAVGPVAAVPAPADTSHLVEVTAPMLGVAYLRPAPDAAPFVAVGDTVQADTTVAVLEVMKLMTNVSAGVAGRVAEVCVVEGSMVEHGAVLLRVEPA